MSSNEDRCPCGSEQSYTAHCGTIHTSGAGLGVSAESLMRARYSAYALHNKPFLLESWHPDTRPVELDFDPELEWLGLAIIDTDAGSGLDNHGIVEFKARFSRAGEHLELHERSSFTRIDGRWVYITGNPADR